jgi:hypothetical protein
MTVVRSDLETAMGAVLTSRSARDMIIDDPEGFAGYFSLTTEESAALACMAVDLAALTPSFVRKREQGLRWPFSTTLFLLAEQGTILTEEYSDMYAPLESAAADSLRFADFLVEQTRELAEHIPYGDVILDVARLEQLRMQCYWTEGPLWPAREEDPLDPGRVDPVRPLWLHRSAAVRRFASDVRTVRSRQDLSRIRPDPANLLVIQRDADGEVVVLRVDDDSARALDLIAASQGEISAADMGRLGGPGRSPESLLGKLIAQGAIRGTQS